MLGLRLSLDLAGILVDGKRAPVDALNHAGMSLEEYGCTRSRVYSALEMPFLEIDVYGMIADVQEGRPPAPRAYGGNDRTTVTLPARRPAPAQFLA